MFLAGEMQLILAGRNCLEARLKTLNGHRGLCVENVDSERGESSSIQPRGLCCKPISGWMDSCDMNLPF